MKFPKTQLPKMIQSGGFVGNFLDLLTPDKSLLFKPDKVLKKLLMKRVIYLKKWQLMT